MTIGFPLAGTTLSQNTYDPLHWARKYQLRNEWFWLVKDKLGVRKPPVTSAAEVKITRVSKRLIDPQNLPAAMKPILDALVEYGHLRGDGPKDILFRSEQRKCEPDERPHMEVTITYV